MRALKNIWYMAAWDDEIPAGRLFHRTVLEKPILFFRDGQGTVRAIGDRCPHRFAPLHLGTLVGDAVQCKYHGLQFGGEGKCVHNPHGPIPSAAKVPAYPIVERYGAVWIWPGDPALADPATLPAFPVLDPEKFAAGHGYLKPKANYELESDNIMDLSHIEFLHPLLLSWVRQQVQRQWISALNRRGQRRKTNWTRLRACPWFELPWAQHPHPMV